jgi:hypothetical protein
MAKRKDTDHSPWDDFHIANRDVPPVGRSYRRTPKEEQQRAERRVRYYQDKQREIEERGKERIAASKKASSDRYYSYKQKEKQRAFDYKAKGWSLTRDQRFITGDDNRKDRAVRAIAKKGAKVAGRALGAAGAASELALPDKTEGRNSDLAAQKARIRGGGGKVKYSQSSRADAVKAIQRERARRKK